MSNTNNTMKTQTSNTLYNAIMEAGGKDRRPMLAPGNYVQWKYRIKIYIDTKPNHELIHYCLKNPLYKYTWADKAVLVSEGSFETTTERCMETYKNVSQDIRDQLNDEAKAIQIILTWIDNDIYSTVDACPNACEVWKAIEMLKQGESINVQDLKTNLQWEFGKFASLDGESLELYYSRSQQAATRNRGKAIVNSPPPIYDQEPSMVAEDDEIGTGYDNQRIGNVAGARETDAAYHKEKMLLCKQEETGFQLNTEQADWRDDIDDKPEYQELKAHYIYMAQIQEVTPDAVDEHNMIIDSLDMSYYREQIDLDDDDLSNECDLLASLIDKLKCEIDDSKNRNNFLETSKKEANNELSKTNELMYKDLKKFQAELDRHNDVKYASKMETDCAKAKGDLMSYKMEFKKSYNRYTQKINDLNQKISKMKKELLAHQETISILS
nr:hypothetical protein [Tanacetum cinerariifolium]